MKYHPDSQQFFKFIANLMTEVVLSEWPLFAGRRRVSNADNDKKGGTPA